MATPSLTTSFLIAGIVFLTISVIGRSKLGFVEINPGFFGRFLALIIGILTLTLATFLGFFPVESLEVFKTYLAEQIQQNLNALSQFLPNS